MATCATCPPGAPRPVAAPTEAPLGVVLGAGQLSTDTRLGMNGGNGGAINTNPLFDWTKHPYAWLIVLALVVIFARRVME